MNQDFFNTANNWANPFNNLQNFNQLFNTNNMQNMAQHVAQAVQSFNQGAQEIIRRNTAAVQENANRVFNNAKSPMQFNNTEEFMQHCNNNFHEQLHHAANHARENAHVLFHSSLEAFEHFVQAMGCCSKQSCNSKKVKA